MLDLDPQAKAAIAGAAVVGIFALLSQLIAQFGSAAARRHDSTRRDIEWFRQHLVDTYGKCLQELYRVVDAGNPASNDEPLDRDLGECLRYLLQLSAYCTNNKARSELRQEADLLAHSWDRQGVSGNALKAAKRVRDLMWADPRIQPQTGNSRQWVRQFRQG